MMTVNLCAKNAQMVALMMNKRIIYAGIRTDSISIHRYNFVEF